ncbi:CGNR zinc finger domain-containing protein [Streptomyces sp. M10(2022)]
MDDSWALRFWQLRAGIDQLIAAELKGDSADSALELVNDIAAGRRPHRARCGEPAGPPAHAECRTRLRALLAVVARDAVTLLTDPVARAGLRRCEGEGCGRLYLDTSRGRRRRWCSSEVCGNRERVARHRRRAAGLAADV